MDLKQLRTFRAVAELGSLSKAADRLRAAQPALSRHIKLLEHELRVELFVRNGRGMLLTSAGRMLLDRTTGLIRQIEQVSDDLKWLVKQKLILPSISHGLRALLEKALAREKLKLDAMIEVDSYRAQISLMEEGLGYTLLPPSAIRTEVAAKRLEMAAVSPSVSRELILASPIAPPPSIATTTIATLIVSEIQQLSKEGLWKINMTA